MESKYRKAYTPFSPNYEPSTPFGQMRKRMNEGKGKKSGTSIIYKGGKGLRDVYTVNHEILEDMQQLYDKNSLNVSKMERVSALVQMKNGYNKMKEKAETMNLDEYTEIMANQEDADVKSQIVSDLNNAKNLIGMFEQFVK